MRIEFDALLLDKNRKALQTGDLQLDVKLRVSSDNDTNEAVKGVDTILSQTDGNKTYKVIITDE